MNKKTAHKLAIFTTFPHRFAVNGGVATATQKLLEAWAAKYPEDELVVIAEQFDKPERLIQRGINVWRLWRPSSWWSLYQSWRAMLGLGRGFRLMLQLELAIYGSAFYTTLVVLGFLLARLQGYHTTIVVHQVVEDITDLSGHIGIMPGSWKALLYNKLLLPTFYRLCSLAASRIIVFEPLLAQRLHKFGFGKIQLIPHGVDDLKIEAIASKRNNHREYLNLAETDFAVTIFGFIAWYKGHHLLLKTAAKLEKDYPQIKFLIAGSESPSQNHNKIYQQYYRHILKTAGRLNNVEILGFIPESEITHLMLASDLVVFPYRTMMSSSGPLAITIAHERPFLLSQELTAVIAELPKKKDHIFRNSTELAEKLVQLVTQPSTLSELDNTSKNMKIDRVWTNLIDAYRD